MQRVKSVGRPRRSGQVSITEQVIASIAGIAALEIEGVAGLWGNVADRLKALLGDERRGVLARLSEDSVRLTLHVAIQYGHPIRQVARRLQMRVKEEVETMTGLRVSGVDVYVQDLMLPGEREHE
ncbi:MAG: hypothetical protein A2Z21_10420 [Candidatus Fraserbacteria bacterium RBG_16_55_9]|uniref:Alkaline-shock protein n=1 Tax=Fraserbacteria sp. (strain RBG_16_55_9) TaxID=1817864 RepID=A0A1F5URR7_FRAXR|nr:MAG: hypothetical protein A2Z21_10420 [Candidatus Fraserbacteria bacterium RBG_16_55_9]